MLLAACTHKSPPHFAQLSAEQTGIQFRNEVTDTDTLNILDYPYLYAGAGVNIGDVNGDGLDDVFFVGNHKGTNKLYLNKGGFRFEDITQKAGVAGRSDWSTGSSMVDINADGRLDIYVCSVTIPGKLKSRNELYLNEGNGRFREAAAEYGLDFAAHATQAAFFDYDRDGDLDCFLLNHGTRYSDDYQNASVRTKYDSVSGGKLLRNDTPQPPEGGLPTAQTSPVGVSASNSASTKGKASAAALPTPLGAGRGGVFTEVSQQAGIYCAPNEYGLGIAVADLNNDGWLDVYVGNDFKENDFCYINNGNGTFSEQSAKLFEHVSRFSMGNDAADYNNDGWLDVMTLDMLSQDEKVLKTSLADDDIEVYNYKQQNFGFHYQFAKNCLQQNMQGKAFCDVGLQKGVAATDWSWAPLLADFNNDGQKDLYVSNGFRYRTNDLDFLTFSQAKVQEDRQKGLQTTQYSFLKFLPAGDVPDYFYLGTNEGSFSDVSAAAGFTQPTLSNGAAYGDLDNDGDLDLVVNRVNGEPGIYRNDFPSTNYLSLSLQGDGGNTFGIGATVYLYTKDEMQMLQQSPVRGFMSSVSPVLHFGLGENKTIDSLIILWPDGRGQKLTKANGNGRLVLLQKKATANFPRPVLQQRITADWQQTTGNAGLAFAHKEDDYDDLNLQPLLPHSLATQGPKLAVGDVNGDGLIDVYVCGAKGQAGAIYTQTKRGGFDSTVQPAFAADSMLEGTDAVFFDADGDRDLDLYLCTGGGEYFGRQPALLDRLYVNDSRGVFALSNGLAELYENGSCVRPCDFDKDGDLDLFVGGRANARMYGYLPASVILKNNGGAFTNATETVSEGLSNAGMITDACWSDVDRDGWTDLIVVGEWMPPTLFKNNKGRLQKQELAANAKGLWQTILPADVDADGDTDFLVGNWGTNTKLSASAEHPLKLYIADWDGNGETEPIMVTAKNGRYYPLYGKADLERRLPFLRKHFLHAKDFAGKTVEEVFGKEALNKAKLFEASTLQSSLLRNNSGKFVLEPLPDFLQTAPLLSFAKLYSTEKTPQFMAGGNFFEVSPYEGRYDAMLPVRFAFENGKAVMKDCLLAPGPLRHIASFPVGGKPAVLLAFNNRPLQLYQTKK